jgi:Raf kinase inhibitor-like YbhB/YbcL family protein
LRAVRLSFLAALIAALALAGCGGDSKKNSPPPTVPATIKVTSPAFKEGGALPVRFTCDGKLGGVNPPIGWSHKPAGTKSQALILTDPDAPGGNFTHWTVWGMMGRTNGLDTDIPPLGLPQGRNSAGTSKYAAPCPPKGSSPHRYEFAIYALKEPIALKPGAPADQVIDNVKRAAIARGVLTGKYSR